MLHHAYSLMQSMPDAAGAPDWVHLMPAGNFTGVDGRGPFEVGRLQDVIATSLVPGRKLPIDINHSTDLLASGGHDTPAVGWIVEMQARDDGIWGKVEWTEKGRDAVAGRAYGYLSPVLMTTRTIPRRVIAIARASLTNVPNLYMTSLNSVQKESTMDHEQFMVELRTALGLDVAADEAAILAAVKGVQSSSHSVDPSRFVPFEMFQETVAELHRVNSGVSQEAAERSVDDQIDKGALMPWMRDWGIELCSANKPAFDNFIATAGKQVRHFLQTLSGPSPYEHIWEQKMAAEGRGAGRSIEPEIHMNLGLSADDLARFGRKETH